MSFSLWKTFTFEAAHQHAGAESVHGHRFEVHVEVSGDLDETAGWVIDFGEIKQVFAPLVAKLDHQFLNQLPELETGTPTAVAEWMENQARGRLNHPYRVVVHAPDKVESKVTQVPACPDRGYPDRYALRFEAAHSLPQTPPGHKCRQLHGHSYQLEVAADNVPELERFLVQLHEELDHTWLNKLPGLANPTAEVLSGWVAEQLKNAGIDPTFVALAETCESACVLHAL